MEQELNDSGVSEGACRASLVACDLPIPRTQVKMEGGSDSLVVP